MDVRKLIFILQLIFLFACTSRDNHCVKKEYYPNGKIKTETTYKGNLRDGQTISYYENGQIQRNDYYQNGVEDGHFQEYYVTGVLEKEGTFIYGTLMGSYYKYYPNGKLRVYNARNYEGENFYSIIFDSLGNKTYEDGMNISPTIADYTTHHGPDTKDTIHLVWLIAEPPGCKNETQVSVMKRNDNDSNEYVLIEPFNNISVNRSIIDYKKLFQQSGNYRIIIGSKLINMSTNYISTDTSIADIKIR